MSEIDFLRITAFIIATGGALEVLRRWVFAPLVKLIRLIEQLVRDVADLIARTGGIEESVDEVKTEVGDLRTDVAEIKGALRAVGLLPGEDE